MLLLKRCYHEKGIFCSQIGVGNAIRGTHSLVPFRPVCTVTFQQQHLKANLEVLRNFTSADVSTFSKNKAENYEKDILPLKLTFTVSPLGLCCVIIYQAKVLYG